MMRFVADANVLFALAKNGSVANSLVSEFGLRLLAPDFALIELYKYKDEIMKKSGVKDFDKIIESLKKKVLFVHHNEYKSNLKKAASMISDPKDATYLALAMRFFMPIWSNDSDLKEQEEVEVFTTKELVEVL